MEWYNWLVFIGVMIAWFFGGLFFMAMVYVGQKTTPNLPEPKKPVSDKYLDRDTYVNGKPSYGSAVTNLYDQEKE